MNVEVPDGVMPGDPMSIMVGDQEFTITVPDGVGPGMLIEVDLPIAEEAPPGPSDEPLTEAVLVDVPPGMGPGDVFNVETAWGGVFEIAVPDGVGPGEQIQVELPTQAAHEGGGPPPPPPPPPPHGSSSAAALPCAASSPRRSSTGERAPYDRTTQKRTGLS